MTDHVRTGYRNHRKATWGLALLLVAAIATVTIPLASGAPPKTVQFVPPLPPVAMQKSSQATKADLSVAVFQGSQRQNSQGQMPVLTVSGAGTIDNFTFSDLASPSDPTYDSTTKAWTWKDVSPKPNAPSGSYTFTVTLGNLAPVASTIRVAEFVCPPSCDNPSNLDNNKRAPGRLQIATFGNPVALDFQADLPVPKGCNNNPNDPIDGTPHTWHRLFIETDGLPGPTSADTYFPAVALDFNYGISKMLQVTYMVKNSDWVRTEAARGNQDIELCAVAKHQDANRNHGAADADKFAGKYGPSTFDSSTGTYSGVLTTVSNPSKVKTDPAICGRGNFSDPVTGVTWRAWTVCIPTDWDWKMG